MKLFALVVLMMISFINFPATQTSIKGEGNGNFKSLAKYASSMSEHQHQEAIKQPTSPICNVLPIAEFKLAE